MKFGLFYFLFMIIISNIVQTLFRLSVSSNLLGVNHDKYLLTYPWTEWWMGRRAEQIFGIYLCIQTVIGYRMANSMFLTLETLAIFCNVKPWSWGVGEVDSTPPINNAFGAVFGYFLKTIHEIHINFGRGGLLKLSYLEPV